MPQLETSDQQDHDSLIRFRRPQSLDLHMIPQHQLLGVRMEVHLLVNPVGNRIAVQGRALKARALAEAAPPEVAAASAVTL
jgi:hypothetical protein